jgi:hypothetical protein
VARFAARPKIGRPLIATCASAILGPDLVAGGRRNLPLSLVEIERRIHFGLAGQQLPKPRLVLEGLARRSWKSPSIFSARAVRSRSSAAALSRLRSACSMLCMVPTGFSVFICAL